MTFMDENPRGHLPENGGPCTRIDGCFECGRIAGFMKSEILLSKLIDALNKISNGDSKLSGLIASEALHVMRRELFENPDFKESK